MTDPTIESWMREAALEITGPRMIQDGNSLIHAWNKTAAIIARHYAAHTQEIEPPADAAGEDDDVKDEHGTPAGATTKAIKACALCMDEYLRLGGKKSDLDWLQPLWWKYHDAQGNLVIPRPKPKRKVKRD